MEYRKIVEVEFVDYTEEALEKSWEWLNDAEIKHLTNTPDFDRESQGKWFEGLKTRNDYYIRAISVENNLVGVCGLKNISDTDGEIWVYIGEKALWGNNIGGKSLDHLIEYSKLRGLNSIYAKILGDNIRSQNLFKRLNFILEKDIEGKIMKMILEL